MTPCPPSLCPCSVLIVQEIFGIAQHYELVCHDQDDSVNWLRKLREVELQILTRLSTSGLSLENLPSRCCWCWTNSWISALRLVSAALSGACVACSQRSNNRANSGNSECLTTTATTTTTIATTTIHMQWAEWPELNNGPCDHLQIA